MSAPHSQLTMHYLSKHEKAREIIIDNRTVSLPVQLTKDWLSKMGSLDWPRLQLIQI
jgi:hypothetical protein